MPFLRPVSGRPPVLRPCQYCVVGGGRGLLRQLCRGRGTDEGGGKVRPQ